MRGPILGIIAVFILQIAVIGYGTVLRFFDAPVEIGSIVGTSASLPEISEADFVEFESYYASGLPRDKGADPQRNFRQPVRSRNGSAESFQFRTFDTEFRPVTISIPKPSPYTVAIYEPHPHRTEYPDAQASDRGISNFEISAKAIDNRNRRGFLSKTFRVIRKPYDWMKAVGSKIK